MENLNTIELNLDLYGHRSSPYNSIASTTISKAGTSSCNFIFDSFILVSRLTRYYHGNIINEAIPTKTHTYLYTIVGQMVACYIHTLKCKLISLCSCKFELIECVYTTTAIVEMA